jgi:hypothetical protein
MDGERRALERPVGHPQLGADAAARIAATAPGSRGQLTVLVAEVDRYHTWGDPGRETG